MPTDDLSQVGIGGPDQSTWTQEDEQRRQRAIGQYQQWIADHEALKPPVIDPIDIVTGGVVGQAQGGSFINKALKAFGSAIVGWGSRVLSHP